MKPPIKFTAQLLTVFGIPTALTAVITPHAPISWRSLIGSCWLTWVIMAILSLGLALLGYERHKQIVASGFTALARRRRTLRLGAGVFAWLGLLAFSGNLWLASCGAVIYGYLGCRLYETIDFHLHRAEKLGALEPPHTSAHPE